MNEKNKTPLFQSPRALELSEQYQALQHAMQSGVKYDLGFGSDDGTPKHLRVGVNTALVEISVLAEMLIRKGLFTDLEYLEALVAGMLEEVRRYEKDLSQKMHAEIKLL